MAVIFPLGIPDISDDWWSSTGNVSFAWNCRGRGSSYEQHDFKMVSSNRTIPSCWNHDGWISSRKCNLPYDFPNPHVTGWTFWTICHIWLFRISVGFGMVIFNSKHS
ncbi:hypothetical protein RJ641_032788 [Dillenia turbinata]|uniref:Uncharacterized protein n=1 Tax=Dillenia turbinata TaxID=194707 RepID=A0AAN8VX32_9MAGN